RRACSWSRTIPTHHHPRLPPEHASRTRDARGRRRRRRRRGRLTLPPQFFSQHPPILVPSRIRPAPRGGGKVLTAPPPAPPERRAAPRINPRPRWHIGC